MKAAAEIIAREIKNQKSRFVFPSETAASLWALKACGFCGERSLALNRFMAWDRFKETAIRSGTREKQPVSSALRKLFAEGLVKKNAMPGEGIFRALIPPEFAEDGGIFAGEIARILPSLGLLRSRQGPGVRDDEDRDFLTLEREYAAFLEKYRLFEPAWEKPPLGDREHGYWIFFPSALEDWEEYRELLSGEPSVRVIDVDDGGGEDGESLRFYYSSPEEIRGAALEIRRLHEEEGIPYEDMAVSVPALEELEPYLLRDLELYDIPVRRRAGKPLADSGAGKIFALAASCAANNFSFDSLKSLLMNGEIPWRRPDLNRGLIEFGVTNNCVSGYFEQGRFIDVWAEALRRAGREEGLRAYYGELKERLNALTGAKDFAELRRRWFAFRGRLWEKREKREEAGDDAEERAARLREAYPGTEHPGAVFQGFLSRDACTGEGDAVLARCVEELSALVRLEEEYPGLTPESPFNFFLEELREKQYVPVRGETGLNLFPYRVAAGAPFAAHFVLGASQQQASVIYRSLKFLRQDKRKALGLRDEDASAVFFRLYRPGSFKTARGDFVSHTFISASERTFSGWAIPHSRFAGRTLRMSPPPGDPFREERAWWACGGAFPRRLFRVQRGGFERWHGLLCPAGRADRLVMANMLRAPLEEAGGAAGLLRGRIDAVQRGGAPGEKALFKVSATDLNGFFYCPLSWLWKKIFRLEGEELEARLLDDASLGLLYHEILKNLYDHIRREDRVFKPENLESYRQWAEESTARAAENYPAFQGPLAVPLLRSMARTIAGKVQTLLGIDARYFPGYTMPELEAVLEIRTGELLLNGRLDRVSVSPEGDPVIIDYKTGKSPSKTESTETFDKALEDFQIPLYVKLYEETRGIKAGGAFFISINQEELTAVIGSPGRKRGHRREDYQPTLDALEDYIGEFAGRVLSLDFVPVEVSLKNCAGCDYRGVCRRTYSLNAPEEAPRVFRNNP